MANDIKVLNHAADNIRILAAAAVEKAKSGHPGGAMGGADFINVLYSEYLQYDPKNPSWVGRDRFFLDPGHMAPMLYSQLCLTGKFSLDELAQLRQWGSATTGHPEYEVARGIENTSGPLGQGHAINDPNFVGFDQIPGLASQRLMAEGYGFGAEGDWKTACLYRSLWVMNQGLEKGCSFLEDYTLNFASDCTSSLQSHMLEVTPLIAVDKPTLEVHFLGITVLLTVTRVSV